MALLAEGATAMLCAYSPDAIALIGLLHDRGMGCAGGPVRGVVRRYRRVPLDGVRRSPSISQQTADMGRQGVEMLLARIGAKRKRRAENRRIPTVFVQRGSVGVAPQAR